MSVDEVVAVGIGWILIGLAITTSNANKLNNPSMHEYLIRFVDLALKSQWRCASYIEQCQASAVPERTPLVQGARNLFSRGHGGGD